MTAIRIIRVSPLTTVQDAGRFGMLAHGIGASGPMDRGAFARAGNALGTQSTAGIEFTGRFAFAPHGKVRASFAGGDFVLRVNRGKRPWGSVIDLSLGDSVEIAPGGAGNYGYVRFDGEIDVPATMGSRATNLIAGLGGLEGRALKAGDVLTLNPVRIGASRTAAVETVAEGPICVVWGLHADSFAAETRTRFLESPFTVTSRMDRMGVRLADPRGVFAESRALSLVSDAIVPGDVQILGDGTPIVLMRDHQPTGGYPRFATVITTDLDRFAQLRPGTELRFAAVTLDKARAALLSSPA